MKRRKVLLIELLLLLLMVFSLVSYGAGLINDVKGKENKGIKVTFYGAEQQLKDGVGRISRHLPILF